MKPRIVLLILLMSRLIDVHAQSVPEIPKAPDVAGLNKYIDFPVDKSTGTANISIPIYTLASKDFKLPISLNYHTGGIKVDDMAGNCGLGWALQAGGTLSRTIKGFPDEGGYYVNHGYSLPINLVGSYGSFGDGVSFDVTGRDTEPDMFYFSVNGYSGKFIIDKYHRVQLIPEQDIKVILDTSASIPLFSKWTIVTPNGVQYIFQDVYDYSRTYSGGEPPFDSGLVPNAWHLSKVITATSETVDFHYIEDAYGMTVNDHGTLNSSNFTATECLQCTTHPSLSFIYGNTIRSISSKNNEIIFNYKTTVREDIDPNYGGSKALDNIVIKDKFTNQIIRQFQLATSYFESTDNIAINPTIGSRSSEPYTVTGYLRKRLKLDAITELSSLGTPLSPYKFYYNKNNVVTLTPNRLSNAQDHWGYYNAKNMNKCLVGEFSGISTCNLVNYLANRNVDYHFKTAYILDEVVYPTSGTVKYLYDNDNNPGLRIKQVITTSGETALTLTKTYNYSTASITGRAPVYAQIYSFTGFGANRYPGGGVQVTTVPPLTLDGTIFGGSVSCIQATLSAPYIAFQDPTNMNGELSSTHAFYGQVTEMNSGNGSIESYFSTYEIDDYIEDTDDYPLIFNRPALEAGKLLKEIVKKEDGSVLQETTYTYNHYYRRIVNAADAIRVFQTTCLTGLRFYSLFTGHCFLTQKQEKINAPNPSSLDPYSHIITTNYDYGGIQTAYKDGSYSANYNINYGTPLHHFVTKESSNLSDGSIVTKRIKYPIDYAIDIATRVSTDNWDSPSLGIKKLLDRGMTGIPVEEITTITKSGTEKITAGKLTFFESYIEPVTNIELLNPKTGLGLEIVNPITYTSTFDSNITKDGTNTFHFNKNSNYIFKIGLDKYDSWSNILEYHQASLPPSSLIWGYNGSYPIAEAKNAAVNQIFYEGFEESTVTGVTTTASLAHSGLRYFNGNTYTVNWTRPDSRMYVITYWYIDNYGNWKHTEQPYTTNSITLNTGSAYDDICIYPNDAQMSVYNYKPSVGLISSIDPSNKPTYYDYDEFNRLLNVKDHNKAIVKNYTYHYNDNSVQYLSASKSGTFQKNDCPNQAVGASVTYTVPAGKYSSPFSQGEADAQAQADVNANGQTYANATAVCTGGTALYYNDEVSQTFTKACSAGQTGSDVVYKINANTYSSSISKADANAQAAADITANGQNNANTTGTCRYTSLLEWNNSVSDNNNKVTRIRFYNTTGSTLLFELNSLALVSQYNSHIIDRGNYLIVVDVQGVQYNSGAGYGCISLTGNNLTRQCQGFGNGTNANTYTFSVDLTNCTSLSFNLEQGPCN